MPLELGWVYVVAEGVVVGRGPPHPVEGEWVEDVVEPSLRVEAEGGAVGEEEWEEDPVDPLLEAIPSSLNRILTPENKKMITHRKHPPRR